MSKIKVVMLVPGKEAYVTEIGEKLNDFQRAVGGYIEAVYPFHEQVCLICNDEGKINGMKPNRALYSDGGDVIDITFGPCFLCGFDEEDFVGLSDALAEQFKQKFLKPERFSFIGGDINVEKYDEGEGG